MLRSPKVSHAHTFGEGKRLGEHTNRRFNAYTKGEGLQIVDLMPSGQSQVGACSPSVIPLVCKARGSTQRFVCKRICKEGDQIYDLIPFVAP